MQKQPQHIPPPPPMNPPDAGKTRLLTLDAVDGRTVAARLAKTLVADLESDLGGADRLSAAERELVQRAALMSAMLGDAEARWLSGRSIDVAEYTTLANTQSRVLKMLGLERRARDVTPDLHRYIGENGPQAVPPVPT
jgi:hypothetical protein